MRTVFNVGSVTHAIHGQKILQRNGLRTWVHRRSADEPREGCGYSLWLAGATEAQIESARRLLAAAGIRILSVEESREA